MKELYQRMKATHEENSDFLIKLFGGLITALVIGMMGWVGISINSMQVTVAKTETNVSNLVDTMKELKAAQNNTVSLQVFNDKMIEVYRRIDDNTQRIKLLERYPPPTQPGNSRP